MGRQIRGATSRKRARTDQSISRSPHAPVTLAARILAGRDEGRAPFSSTTSATPIRRYAQATLTASSIASTTLQHPTPTPTPTPSKTMKLTVAALALLVAGASYADMAAAWATPLMDALESSNDGQGNLIAYFGQCGGMNPDSKGRVKCSGKGFSGHKDVPWTYQAKMDKKDPNFATESFKVHGEDTWTDGSGNVDKFSGHLTCKAGKFGGKIKDSQKYTTGKNKITLTCSGTMEGASCSWH